jgi:hypothetical protein
MSTSIAAQAVAAGKSKRISRKTVRTGRSRGIAGAAAIGCIVLGAGWTVYTNILGASVYPTVGSAGYDEPLIKRAPKVALRDAGEAVKDVFALLPNRGEMVTPITRDMFNERFAASAPQGVGSNAAHAATPPVARVADARETPKPPEPVKLAEAPKSQPPAKIADAAKARRAPDTTTQLALNEPPATARVAEAKPAKSGMRDLADRAKAAVLSIASHDRSSIVEKLWGKREPSSGLLAYASADASVTASIAPREQNPMLGGSPPYDRSTAVYDITAKTVYLPDGTRLEAHSGLGSNLDDPRSSRVRMRGVTPPHIYELKPREALFHGVPALRLNPIGGESAIYGRDGLLAHTFMLGPNGDSNGCVSFKDYYAFLDAYRNKGIRKLAVVARVD